MKWAKDPRSVGLHHRRFDLCPLAGFAAAKAQRIGIEIRLKARK
jgi:hypothetical protein